MVEPHAVAADELRATRDVDVLAILIDEQLVTAEPLPGPVTDSAAIVARDFSLPADWLNSGPTSLLDFGLPEGFVARAERRRYGLALEVLFASRLDQIHFKLYASVDRGAGRHLEDLKALRPTAEELRAAASWSRTHEISEGYREQLGLVLDHMAEIDGAAGA
jgi:hypothetical protein